MTAIEQSLGERIFSRHFWRDNGTIVVLVAFVIFAAALSQGVFLRPTNLVTILYQASIVGVLVLGQSLVVIAGGIDLSVVAILILSAVVMGGMGSERQAMMSFGALPYIGFLPALIAGFVLAGFIGMINGILVTKARIPALVTTLATALLVGSLILLTTGGSPIYYPDPFYSKFGETRLLGLPAPVYVFVGVALAVWWLLSRTAFGRRLYAIGGSERAARYTGIRVDRLRIGIYTLSGLFAATAGFLFLSRTGYIAYSSGGDLLMSTIAAMVVGGVSLSGGIGGVKHAVTGVLLLASLSNFMNIMLISPYIQNAVNGAAILVAVSIYSHINEPGQ